MRQNAALEKILCLAMFLVMLSLWSNTDRCSVAAMTYGGTSGPVEISSLSDPGLPLPLENSGKIVSFDTFVDIQSAAMSRASDGDVAADHIPHALINQFYPDIPVPPSEV